MGSDDPLLNTAASLNVFLRLFRPHQAQVGGGADFSWIDEASFLERRQVLFDRHEMGGSMTGRRGRIDVIANQNSAAGNEQAVKLRVKLWDTARVTELVHGLQRDD